MAIMHVKWSVLRHPIHSEEDSKVPKRGVFRKGVKKGVYGQKAERHGTQLVLNRHFSKSAVLDRPSSPSAGLRGSKWPC